MKVMANQARAVSAELLEMHGVLRANAELQADLLVEAELRGHPSHGLQRLPRILKRIERGLIAPNATGRQQWRSTAFLAVDGEAGLGPVVARSAIASLVERVATTGIAAAGIGNANHLGMLAFYARLIVDKSLIGIVLSSSEALVHPYGGSRAMLGTNPIAIGVPTGEEPFVLDLATSVVSMGKIHAHALRDQPIPRGWALDREGAPTTDAEAAKDGAIAPFGGAKGYGLGLAFELLVASLANTPPAPEIRGTLDADHLANKGDVIIVIKPGGEGAPSALATYLDALRHAPSADGMGSVSVPGDRSRQRRQQAMDGGFEVAPRLWEDLVSAAPSTRASIRNIRHENV